MSATRSRASSSWAFLSAVWTLLGLGAASAFAQELVPAGSINGAADGPKKVIVVQADPAVVAYAKAVRKRFFADAELIEEAGAVAGSLTERDVIFFGTPSHPWLDSLRDRLPFRYKDGAVELEGRRFEGAHLRVICAIRNPEAPARRALLYTAAKAEDVVNINAVFHGPTEWVVADGGRTLAAGSFRGPPLSVEHLKADLDEYVRRVRDVHPATTDGMPAELEEAIKRAQGEIAAPMTRDRFWRVLTHIALALHDAHSTIDPVLSGESLDLPVLWTADGLIVTDDAGPLRKGDRILRLESRSESEVLDALRAILPSENVQWVRFRGESVLRDFGLLKTLGLAKEETLAVTVERGGKEVNASLAPGFVERGEKSRPWVSFDIDKAADLAVFTLDQCVNNEEYRKSLDRFFDAVRENKITRVAVDVRRNTGGNSTVWDSFFRHVDVETYTTFGAQVRASAESRARGGPSVMGPARYPPRPVKNRRVEDPYRGKLFVLTSKATFSSGNWIAVLVQDNKLGQVLGEATGNAPSSLGDILSFTLERSALTYYLSFKRWQRPDPARDPADALTPDRIIATTRAHVSEGVDPVLEFLRKSR